MSAGSSPAWRTAWVGLGSNLGDRRARIEEAVARLGAGGDIRWEKLSRLRETEPVGGPPQGRYLNGAGEISTRLGPRALLARILEVESELGRVREVPCGPRTIDVDILVYAGLVVSEPGLTLPHPRLGERGFVLEPLAEIAPRGVHPVLGRTFLELWEDYQRRHQAGGVEADP